MCLASLYLMTEWQETPVLHRTPDFMTRTCGCSGHCGDDGMDRREFLQVIVATAAGIALTAKGEANPKKKLVTLKQVERSKWTPIVPNAHTLKEVARGAGETMKPRKPRTYRGKQLDYVLMPIGGIGTGSVWLDGQGRLAVWQLFNNFTEERIPDCFFSIRTQQGRKPAIERVLQTTPEGDSKPFTSLTYEGGYPIARLEFQDKELPVDVQLEAFSPFIPLDAFHSALPCAIFRWTVKNSSQEAVSVSLTGRLPNAKRAGGGLLSCPTMPIEPGTLSSGPVHVRKKAGGRASDETLFWMNAADAADLLSAVPGKGLWEVFEDFESGTYANWTVKGTAFGDAPHTGTTPGQNPVSGFWGKRLVNSFVPNDQPQGELISKPFTIRHSYIGFLVGGGAHKETCIQLRVGDEVVRRTSGRTSERLEPAEWDVSEFMGKEAVIEIIDHHSGGWGHINVDHIVFSNEPPVPVFKRLEPLQAFQPALNFEFDRCETVATDTTLQLTDTGREALPANFQGLRGRQRVRLTGYRSHPEWKVLAQNEAGEPLLLTGQVGNLKIALSLVDLSEAQRDRMLSAARGKALSSSERFISAHPLWGEVMLCTDTGGHPAQVSLKPGEQKTVSFVLSWYYPNVDRFGHPGNQYARHFTGAKSVADYVLKNLTMLYGWTKTYHETVYASNLPDSYLDAVTSQAVILRSPTCFWSEDGYFGGFEGSYGCCPLNCTHVWNYAQTHARLFPEVGRNMRESDLLVYLHPNGETSHRQHTVHHAFIDGHCATICAAYREHLTSPDSGFLKRVWSKVKLATDWLIQAIDRNEEGINHGHQWNTYDCATGGQHTFIGSQYLCALAAAERMASLMGDQPAAERYRRIRETGSRNQVDRLWNGEYFIQIPDEKPAHDYNTGCHTDQLLGQWWAYQLGLGDLYPQEQMRTAMAAVFKHNFRERFAGFRQVPRRYVIDEEGGLLMCTWPHGGRPNPFIIYADEVWTGIEYMAAGLMTYLDMLQPAVKITDTARGRYDGVRRDGLDSGPGGNPFNDLECGKFYARAMSAFGLLLSSQGFILDAPAGVIGFEPHWSAEDHQSFFIGAEGWGSFSQKISRTTQTETITLRYGQLNLSQLVFRTTLQQAEVSVNGKNIPAELRRDGERVFVRLKNPLALRAGEVLKVVFKEHSA